MNLRINILIALFALSPLVAHSQARPLVAGLENNAEYAQLLDDEHALSSRRDSLDEAITLLREEFRASTDGRTEYSARILRLEKELFEVSAQADAAAARITAIEEAFLIEKLRNGDSPADNDTITPPPAGKQSADLSANDVFRKLLPERDYAALVRAQSRERAAEAMALRYLKNYAGIEELAAAYADASDAVAADSIFALYLALDGRNKVVADSLGAAWHDIYDDKLFAYNYLLQSRNQTRLLSRLEALGRDARDEIAARRGNTVSEELSEYFARKKHALEYEKAIAELLGESAAADSLNRAADRFALIGRELPKIDLEERYFIDYSDISFRTPAAYTASDPIPECAVYRRGLVYRIRMGSYPARQAVSVFKGAYPLGYLNESGKWDYYAGGFSDLEKAKTALADIVRRGFRNALIVMWNDGAILALDDKPAAGTAYRVEITGANTGLSEEVRETIRKTGNDTDIALSGGIFIAGPFATPLEAETVADAVRKTDNTLTVRTLPNR